MASQGRTYVEEFLNFNEASRWLEGHLEDYKVKNIWVVTEACIIFKGGLYKCTFSVNNQKAMS